MSLILRLFFVLFFLLALVPVVGATVSPPSAVVFETDSVQFFPVPSGSFTTNGTLTWRVSAEDPDQINGSFQYGFYFNSTTFASGWARTNVTDAAIPGRPGWLTFSAWQVSGLPQQPNNAVWGAMNMTAWNGTSESVPSCLVNVTDLRVVQAHDQCGVPIIRAPDGVNAFVNQTANASRSGAIDLRWTTSLDDPTANASGSLNYTMLESDVPSGSSPTPFFSIGLDPVTAQDAGGVRFYTQTFGGQAPFAAQFKIRASDPLTRQRANDSCVAIVNTGNLYEANGCGNLTLPGLSAIGPAFPLLDVPAFATATGMSLDAVGWFLGGFLLFGIAIGGFAVAGPVGALIGGSLGFAAVGALGLIPLWLVVVAFMAAASVCVLLLRGGSSGS